MKYYYHPKTNNFVEHIIGYSGEFPFPNNKFDADILYYYVGDGFKCIKYPNTRYYAASDEYKEITRQEAELILFVDLV